MIYIRNVWSGLSSILQCMSLVAVITYIIGFDTAGMTVLKDVPSTVSISRLT